MVKKIKNKQNEKGDFDDKGLELHGSTNIFYEAVMRVYHILTALLHFLFSPSLHFIKRVFLINNKCSKQRGVQLRERR